MNFSVLTKDKKKVIIISSLCMLLLYCLSAYFFGNELYHSKIKENMDHEERVDPHIFNAPYPKSDGYTELKTGVFISSIRKVDIVNSSFEVDFQLWFNWKGSSNIHPGETIQILEGKINSISRVTEYHKDGVNYECYDVSATIDKIFNIHRFSLENHMLNIMLEDNDASSESLRYVPDEKNTGIDPEIKIPGFIIDQNILSAAKPYLYQTNYSYPEADSDHSVYSRYIVGININRNGFNFLIKILLPFILSAAIALAVLWLNPLSHDSRFGLVGAAFFGAIANSTIINTYIPHNGGTFGLLDIYTFGNLATLLLLVTVSMFSRNLFHKHNDTNYIICLERTVFFAVLLGYIIFNMVLPLCTYNFS